MSARPDPPTDSEELTEYVVGDEVYYYRAGTTTLRNDYRIFKFLT